uniref:RanBP2-type domain-containing protein n=1 Tax=Macrostomum lignano TaxID=282301 RepID=A0A1I8GDM4_9PLAT
SQLRLHLSLSSQVFRNICMHMQHTTTMVPCISNTIAGLAQTTAALTCYEGNHTTVTGEFPTSSPTCTTKDKTELCVEKRRTNWDSEPGFFELYFGCGKCGSFDNKVVECQECKTDKCNSKYGSDLKPSVSKLKLCYNSLITPKGPLPIPVYCPKEQNCTYSRNPSDADHILTGCQSHCPKLKWKDCQYCSHDLCNLNVGSVNSSGGGGGGSGGGSGSGGGGSGGSVAPAPTQAPILMEKVELPPPPPSMEVAKASVESSNRGAESDK